MSSSEDYHSLAHSKWDCKYHLVFIPKGRKRRLYGEIRPRLGQIFHALAEQKDCKILEGHLMPDHVHMLVEVPPKHAVSSVIGFLKGKSAIAIAREFGGKQRNYTGEHFWARGYAISTVGYDEQKIRKYIREQEVDDARSSAQGAF
jgi:putative transposase